MIHVTMFKGFSRLQGKEVTDAQSRKLRRSMKAYDIHVRNMKTTYVSAPLFALKMASPFDNAVPIIPWL